MTIYHTLLARGYFPKELPPAFSTEQFAQFAVTKEGRKLLLGYKPADGFTDCVRYQLALPGMRRRQLGLPHPASFAQLAQLSAKNFRRLLKKGGRSVFSRSRPVYRDNALRALMPAVKPGNLPRERMLARAGSRFLVKVDVSQFYPSLYTHAIGWAVDPKLRRKIHWKNYKLLGKQLDQRIMDLQGKVSQGVPVGNDLSFLLSEIVLASIDRSLRRDARSSYRWFDDYELACNSLSEADELLAQLTAGLARFNLRLNPLKTSITRLPQPSQEDWQQVLREGSKRPFTRVNDVISFFDSAFRLRDRFPDQPVMLYALGLLFRLDRPNDSVQGVVHSGLSQALLCEPGVAQKAFALLTFWHLNGFSFDRSLLSQTVSLMVEGHHKSGVTSDVSWALAFCLDHDVSLSRRAAKVLATCTDDATLIQALHCDRRGLLPKSFSTKAVTRLLKDVSLDGEHWLLAYESLRHDFSKVTKGLVGANPLFSRCLALGLTFYRTSLPRYSSVVHPGGAPSWLMSRWLVDLREPDSARLPFFQLLGEDVRASRALGDSEAALLSTLLAATEGSESVESLSEMEHYFG